MAEISKIIKGCNYLRILNISGNPIDTNTCDCLELPPTIRVIVWQKNNLKWEDVSTCTTQKM